jgi:thioredoxin reductase
VLSVPVISNSKLSDPDLAEQVLADGKGDFISIGRGLIADPDLPKKLLYGQTDRIRKCLSCNIGCFGNLTLLPRRPSRCTVNPVFGHESKLPDYVEPTTQKKKVVVVGAGPGGMSAALTACQRGHDVVLFEKTETLGGGGHFHQATIPPFKQENLFVPEYYEREFKEQENLRVVFNTTADAGTVLREKPDVVVIATGGGALVPELPGIDNSQVITYEDVLLGRRAVGDHVVIIGGGSVGCETGLFLLLNEGKRVTILERLYRMADSVEIATRNCLMEELEKAGAEMIPGARVSAVSGGRVSYIKGGTESTVEGDTVVIAMGAKSENQLHDDLRYEKVNLHLIGDAREPRTIMHAVSEGFFSTYRS